MPDNRLPRARIQNAVTLALCVLGAGAGCSRPKTETPKDVADARPPSVTPAATAGVKPALNPDKPAEEKQGPPPKKQDREDPEAALAKAIQNAEPLAAPALIPGKANINEFSPTIRKLVSDEFAFKDAQRKVYRASFSQRSVESLPLVKLTDARNAIVQPGTYDFDRQRATWTLHLWHIHWGEKTIGTSVYPETADSCSLVASFDLDEKTARGWREAYDRGSLSLSVWVRPVKALRADWKTHPRFNDGTQTHDIAIEVEVLRFEAQLDTPAPKNPPGAIPPPKKPVNPGDRNPFDDRK
jgi:hypothetical protein